MAGPLSISIFFDFNTTTALKPGDKVTSLCCKCFDHRPGSYKVHIVISWSVINGKVHVDELGRISWLQMIGSNAPNQYFRGATN